MFKEVMFKSRSLLCMAIAIIKQNLPFQGGLPSVACIGHKAHSIHILGNETDIIYKRERLNVWTVSVHQQIQSKTL